MLEPLPKINYRVKPGQSAPKKFVFTPLPTPEHLHQGACRCIPTVAYIRVSAVKTRDRIVSPDVQLAACAAWARTHGHKIIDVIFDINETGQEVEERASIRRVVEDMHAGRYAHLVVWKWSRWGRNIAESLKMLSLIEDAGGAVDSATEPFDQETVIGEYGRDQMLLVADLQGKVIGETWRGVHDNRREAGLPHTGRARFGYDYVRGRYVPNEEAPAVTWCYQAIVEERKSFRWVTQQLNAAGYLTTRGGRWTPQAVARMLDTGFAAGLIRERTPPKSSRQRRKRKPANRITDYDIWRLGTHDSVIDEETWRKYRALREASAHDPASGTAAPSRRRAAHVLSSMLACGVCGRRMVTKYSGAKRQHQWVCPWRKDHHADGVSVSISNAAALAAVREWLAREGVDKPPADLAERARRAKAKAVREDERESRRRAAEAQLEKAKSAQKKLRRAFALSEDMDEAELERELAEFVQMEARAREELAKFAPPPKSAAAARPESRAFHTLLTEWDRLATMHPEGHREALRRLVAEVRVFPLPAPPRRGNPEDRVKVVGSWEAASAASSMAQIST